MPKADPTNSEPAYVWKDDTPAPEGSLRLDSFPHYLRSFIEIGGLKYPCTVSDALYLRADITGWQENFKIDAVWLEAELDPFAPNGQKMAHIPLEELPMAGDVYWVTPDKTIWITDDDMRVSMEAEGVAGLPL